MSGLAIDCIEARHMARTYPSEIQPSASDDMEALLAEVKRLRSVLADSATRWTPREWEDWSNSLADLLPEEYDDDIAQEAIIPKAINDMAAKIDRVRAVEQVYRWTGSDQMRALREALSEGDE